MPRRELLYMALCCLFITCLVVANMMAASKLWIFDLGFTELVLVVGVIPYPVTFLVTDTISELYGDKRASHVVWVGFVVSLVMLGFLQLAVHVPEVENGQQERFAAVFGTAPRAVFASMVAYLVAQLVDVRLFHFWKRLTKGKHLWLRNNGSTIGSQLIDTLLVTFILFVGTQGIISEPGVTATLSDMWPLMVSSFGFKLLIALCDTPLLYLAVWLGRDMAADTSPLGGEPETIEAAA